MKYVALFLFLLFSLGHTFAQSFMVEGTNVIQVVYADTNLTAQQKQFIGTDIIRTVAPGLNFTSLHLYTNNITPLKGYLRRLNTLHGSEKAPALSRGIKINGTNIYFTIEKECTDYYLQQMPFFNVHSNAIAQAFEFAEFLVTNPVTQMTTNQIRGLRLTRTAPPGQIPLKYVEVVRNSLSYVRYFPPSLLGFELLPYGPLGAAEYLWGYLPVRSDYIVNSVPIIYYNNRWWISYWFMEEEGEEE